MRDQWPFKRGRKETRGLQQQVAIPTNRRIVQSGKAAMMLVESWLDAGPHLNNLKLLIADHQGALDKPTLTRDSAGMTSTSTCKAAAAYRMLYDVRLEHE